MEPSAWPTGSCPARTRYFAGKSQQCFAADGTGSTIVPGRWGPAGHCLRYYRVGIHSPDSGWGAQPGAVAAGVAGTVYDTDVAGNGGICCPHTGSDRAGCG